MDDESTVVDTRGAARLEERHSPAWIDATAVVIWLAAATVAFIPFASDTSAWNAVTLRVPGNQGNWWHVLVGAPFFLAYPMVWIRLHSLFSTRIISRVGRRTIWSAVGICICGTVLVETPFLLHLAGTSAWQRMAVLSLGFGILVASSFIFYLRRARIPPAQAMVIGIETAYLANLALCLVVYSEATGTIWSRSGWIVSMVLVWPMALDVVGMLSQIARVRTSEVL